MLLYKKTSLLLFVSLGQVSGQVVLACEPVAFDFDLFLKTNDRNRDGFISEKELLTASLKNQSATLYKTIKSIAAFRELDKNKDKKLSAEELWEWGRYVHNGCEEMPRS